MTKLEYLRRKSDLTQVELSQKSGVSAPVIIKIERGRIDNVVLGTLRKLANALSCGVEDLI